MKLFLVPDKKNSKLPQMNFPLRNSRDFYSSIGEEWILYTGAWVDTATWRDDATWNDGE